MPSSPVLGNVCSEKRMIEINHEIKTKQTGNATGNISVARKVGIYLNSKKP